MMHHGNMMVFICRRQFTYCLSLSPLQFQLITPQNKSMPALSRPASLLSTNNILPSLHFFYPFFTPPPPQNILPCTSFKNSFCFQSILTAAFYLSEFWYRYLLINLPSTAPMLFFYLWHHASNIYSSFLKPCFKAVCQLLLSILSPSC